MTQPETPTVVDTVRRESERLAREYLAEHAIDPRDAVALDIMAHDGLGFDESRLTPDELARAEELGRLLDARLLPMHRRLWHIIRPDPALPPGSPYPWPDDVSADLRRELEAALRRFQMTDSWESFTSQCVGVPVTGGVAMLSRYYAGRACALASPEYAAWERERDEIQAKAQVSGDDLQRFIDRHLTDAAGRRRELPREWLTRNGYGGDASTSGGLSQVSSLWLALQAIASETAYQRAEQATERAEAAERSTVALEEIVESTWLRVPDAVRRGWLPDRHTKMLERLDKPAKKGARRLVANDGDRATLQALAARVGPREFADLTQGQIRAVVAVLSGLRDDRSADPAHGRVALPETKMTWNDYCRLASVDPRQMTTSRELLAATFEMADRRVHFEIPVRLDDGDGLRFAEGPLFRVEVEFLRAQQQRDRKLWDAAAEKRRAAGEDPGSYVDLFARWQEWRQARGSGQPWTGPLPHSVRFAYPDYVRRLDGALVFRGDVLERLLAAAKAETGQAKLGPLVWPLLMEVAGTRQAPQFEIFEAENGEPAGSAWAYIDRTKLIRDYRPHEEWTRKPGRSRAYYDDAVRVLMRAGFVVKVEADHKTDNGLRDRMLPAPDLIAGLSTRALASASRADARRRAEQEATDREARRRVAAKGATKRGRRA